MNIASKSSSDQDEKEEGKPGSPFNRNLQIFVSQLVDGFISECGFFRIHFHCV